MRGVKAGDQTAGLQANARRLRPLRVSSILCPAQRSMSFPAGSSSAGLRARIEDRLGPDRQFKATQVLGTGQSRHCPLPHEQAGLGHHHPSPTHPFEDSGFEPHRPRACRQGPTLDGELDTQRPILIGVGVTNRKARGESRSNHPRLRVQSYVARLRLLRARLLTLVRMLAAHQSNSMRLGVGRPSVLTRSPMIRVALLLLVSETCTSISPLPMDPPDTLPSPRSISTASSIS